MEVRNLLPNGFDRRGDAETDALSPLGYEFYSPVLEMVFSVRLFRQPCRFSTIANS
jgi:hypothetical protein